MNDDDITKPDHAPLAPADPPPVTDDTPPAVTLLEAAVACAMETVGVKEVARNSGPEIDLWLAGVGLLPGQPWCAAWVHAMFLRAARAIGAPSPCPRTGSALRLYQLADDNFKLAWSVAVRNDIVRPGQIFVESHGEGKGHCGIVLGVDPKLGGVCRTVSGNTNEAGSREGNAVVVQWRQTENWLGILDFGRP